MLASELQSYLQDTFSMPFAVRIEPYNGFSSYVSYPANEDQAYFEVRTFIQNDIRIVVEVSPQKYAKHMLEAMFSALPEKRNVFKQYMESLLAKGVRSSLEINGANHNQHLEHIFDSPWRSLKCRLTKVPIVDEGDSCDETYIICEWTKQAFCLFFSLLTITEDASNTEIGFEEGRSSQIMCNKYERNPINRELCIAKKGYICNICGFDFKKVYGKIGEKFIHVHHIVPVSQIGAGYLINPEKDLIPVCPNCHAMLHRKNPPYLPEEIKNIIKGNNNDKRFN